MAQYEQLIGIPLARLLMGFYTELPIFKSSYTCFLLFLWFNVSVNNYSVRLVPPLPGLPGYTLYIN